MNRLVPITIALSLTILLVSIAMAQSLANVHLSDAPHGPAMTQFPSQYCGTIKVTSPDPMERTRYEDRCHHPHL